MLKLCFPQIPNDFIIYGCIFMFLNVSIIKIAIIVSNARVYGMINLIGIEIRVIPTRMMVSQEFRLVSIILWATLVMGGV